MTCRLAKPHPTTALGWLVPNVFRLWPPSCKSAHLDKEPESSTWLAHPSQPGIHIEGDPGFLECRIVRVVLPHWENWKRRSSVCSVCHSFGLRRAGLGFALSCGFESELYQSRTIGISSLTDRSGYVLKARSINGTISSEWQSMPTSRLCKRMACSLPPYIGYDENPEQLWLHQSWC